MNIVSLKMDSWSVKTFWVLPYLGENKTLLTASLFIKQPRLGSDINYFLPKPIKLLMCWVLSPGPIMEINQKNHLSYSKPGRYLV